MEFWVSCDLSRPLGGRMKGGGWGKRRKEESFDGRDSGKMVGALNAKIRSSPWLRENKSVLGGDGAGFLHISAQGGRVSISDLGSNWEED